jgi:hypothetical protein
VLSLVVCIFSAQHGQVLRVEEQLRNEALSAAPAKWPNFASKHQFHRFKASNTDAPSSGDNRLAQLS